MPKVTKLPPTPAFSIELSHEEAEKLALFLGRVGITDGTKLYADVLSYEEASKLKRTVIEPLCMALNVAIRG